MENIKKDTRMNMEKCIKNFSILINKLRTDRASPDLIKDLSIEYYGKKILLHNISNIIVEDSRTLRINTFDKNTNKEIEKAIMNSNLGLNPISVGGIIRVPIPPLTEERRKNLIKILYQKSEKSKICIRMVRKNSNNIIKNLIKNKSIGKNEEKKYINEIQILTDFYIKEIDNLKKIKEKSLFHI